MEEVTHPIILSLSKDALERRSTDSYFDKLRMMGSGKSVSSVGGEAMPWVYILRCRDDSYYVGSTVELEKRLAKHQAATYCGYTASRRPVTLVFCYEVALGKEAFLLERQIKGWSRAKKEALIAGRFDLLPGLSRSKSGSRHPSTGSG